MTPTKSEYPWWAKLLTESVKSFGVTTVIVMVLLYVTVKIIIPEMVSVANRYCNAVEKTQLDISETQKAQIDNQKAMISNQQSIVETQKQLVEVVSEVSSAAQEIISVEKQSQIVMQDVQGFMQTVCQDHRNQSEKLEKIEAAVSTK